MFPRPTTTSSSHSYHHTTTSSMNATFPSHDSRSTGSSTTTEEDPTTTTNTSNPPQWMLSSPPRSSRGRSIPQQAPYSSTTIKRLSDVEVRAIFECLHHNTTPPSNIHFTIVPVGPNGLRLSPPPYEFEDGLYVLLRPAKKNKKRGTIDVPEAPEHLQHLVMRQVPAETCPWGLSGPQFPQPTAIQQRYCYPKGRHEYSNQKGGALWTMYSADGKEDVEFRLLHVYYSAKRAVNKGMDVFEHDNERQQSQKRQRRENMHTAVARLSPPPPAAYHQPDMESLLIHSPAITSSSAEEDRSPSPLCNSPISFEMLPPPPLSLTNDEDDDDGNLDPSDGAASCTSTAHNSMESSSFYPTWPEQLIVTPINDIHDQPIHCTSNNKKHPQNPRNATVYGGYDSDSSMGNVMTPSPFRNPISSTTTSQTCQRTLFSSRSPHERSGALAPISEQDDWYSDPFPCDFLDFQQELDHFWNDSVFGMLRQSSRESFNSSPPTPPNSSSPSTWNEKLDSLQQTIRKYILSAPFEEQPRMVSTMSVWARQLCLDPLAIIETVPNTKVETSNNE